MSCGFMPYVGVEEVKDWKSTLKALLAEFLGTMMLVLLGCGACWKVRDLNHSRPHQTMFEFEGHVNLAVLTLLVTRSAARRSLCERL